MNLRQIKYFLAVVDSGTFLSAAERVHVSQPTLSAGIKKLEESLGAQLLYRGSREATLTVEGEFFLQHARQAYEKLELAKSKLSNCRERVSIGLINTIPVEFGAGIIQAYKNIAPTVLLEVEVGGAAYLADLFASEKIDLLFTTELGLEANFTPLFDERLKLVASNQHSLAKFENIDIRSLKGHPFIERARCESWGEVHRIFDRYDLSLYAVCKAESDETILSLVAANLGVAIMPERNTPYPVKFIKIKQLDVSRTVGIYTQPNNESESLKSFCEVALEMYNKAPLILLPEAC
ncbi:MAG: LysR family transcriptional regulator [Xanthomonadales bacterium]|nr:LysR family transcriptional regulator [Xanthomonadales bacterium]